MNTSQIINIVLGVLSVLITFVGYYFYIRGKAIKAAQKAVNDAEQDDKTGAEKLQIAVEQVYSLIPPILKPVITRTIITGIVQAAFDKIEAYAKKQIQKKTVTTGGGFTIPEHTEE